MLSRRTDQVVLSSSKGTGKSIFNSYNKEFNCLPFSIKMKTVYCCDKEKFIVFDKTQERFSLSDSLVGMPYPQLADVINIGESIKKPAIRLAANPLIMQMFMIDDTQEMVRWKFGRQMYHSIAFDYAMLDNTYCMIDVEVEMETFGNHESITKAYYSGDASEGVGYAECCEYTPDWKTMEILE